MQEIESHTADLAALPPVDRYIAIQQTEVSFGTMLHTMFVRYRSRAVLGLVLIASQAFFYNGISFTYPLVLSQNFDVPADRTGAYVLVMAVANFLGPLLLGHLFDSVGRRTMISATYAFSGALHHRHRVSVPARRVDGLQPDAAVGGHVLLRLGGGERGLT